mgnify:CR=1 FL=1
MNRITKEDLSIDSQNNIRINPEKEMTYYDEGYSKQIKVDGETYYTKPKGEYYKKKLGVMDEYIEFDFDLLDLSYKYYRSDLYFERFEYKCSQNSYVNTICNLANYDLFDKRILAVYSGKGVRCYWHKGQYEKYWEWLMIDDKLDVLIDTYGWSNSLWYQIKAQDLFKIPYKTIKKHNSEFIDFFAYFGIYLKYGYKKNIEKYNAKKKQYKEQQERAKNKYNYNAYIYNDYVKPASKTYILKDKNTGYYKIGKSINPLDREKTLQAEKPTYELIKIFNNDIETDLHKKYKKQNVRGEWFNLNKVQLKYICTSYE